jgi:hypothetical protein
VERNIAMDKRLPSSFVRILNCANRILNGREDWNQLTYLLQKTDIEVSYFREVINQLSPILRREDGGESFLNELNEILDKQEEYLQQAVVICKTKKPTDLMKALTALGDNYTKLEELKEKCTQLTDNMSNVSSSAILNEIILTGIEVSRKKGEPELMRKKLPALMQYINYIEETTLHLKKRFPEEEVLTEFFETQVKAMKEAAGGIYIFLEEGKVEDLAVAVTLLDRAGEALWAAFSALHQTNIRQKKYSDFPKVDDAYHFLHKYIANELTEEDMRYALKRLKIEQANDVNNIARFKNNVFLYPELAEKFIPVIENILHRQDLLLAYMNDNIKDKSKLEEAIEKYNNLATQLHDTWMELNLERNEPPKYLGSSNFVDLLDTIKNVYEYHIPDFTLEQKVMFLDEFQQEFRKQVRREMERSPNTTEAVEQILETLDKQKEGIEKIYNYLETENRTLLLESYRIIEDTTLQLTALSEKIQNFTVKEANETLSCPFCLMENPKNAGYCVKCRRELPTRTSGSLEKSSFEITEDGETFNEYENNFVQVPFQTIDSIIQVIEDTANENLKFEESQEILIPYWEQIQSFQEKIDKQIVKMIDNLQDPELTENFKHFKDSFDFLQDSVQKALDGLQERDMEALKNSIGALTEAGNRLNNIHTKLENFAANAFVSS